MAKVVSIKIELGPTNPTSPERGYLETAAGEALLPQGGMSRDKLYHELRFHRVTSIQHEGVMIFLIIAGIVLAILVLKLILPLMGEALGIVIAGVLIFSAIALCIAFPPLLLVLICIGIFIALSNSKSKKK